MQYTYKRTISDEDIVDLMESALQGITNWAGEARVVNNKKLGEFDGWTSEALVRGYNVRIWDAEEEKWYTLTLKKLLKGLAMRTSFDPENYDAYDGDCIIQYALFGKLVYA